MIHLNNILKRKKNGKERYAKYLDEQKRLRERHSQYSFDTLVSSKTVFEDNASVASGDIRDSFIGRGSYMRHNVNLPNCYIGRFCSIASNVFCVISNHPIDRVSTYPGFYRTPYDFLLHFDDENEGPKYKHTDDGFNVHVGNDVWIGENVRIMSGTKIGDGAIVGTGAVVTKDVPPYAIVGGVPAKIIRFRFPKDEIDFLLKTKWWDWPIDKIKAYSKHFSTPSDLKAALTRTSDIITK